MGCDPARLPSEKRSGGGMLVDDFLHEQATCFNVKGKGLVVMTSCGHRGIVNTGRAVRLALALGPFARLQTR
jgi:7,8-dihydropterin-6-yl-methyl-4-(beta-D-ribofuranosyl)aminobenzene 5'-phosphate synthase